MVIDAKNVFISFRTVQEIEVEYKLMCIGIIKRNLKIYYLYFIGLSSKFSIYFLFGICVLQRLKQMVNKTFICFSDVVSCLKFPENKNILPV